VTFQVSDEATQDHNDEPASHSISENIETIKAKLSQYEEEIIPLAHRPEIVNNFENLQKKYEALLDLVMKYTAERDEHLGQYETLRREYASLLAIRDSETRFSPDQLEPLRRPKGMQSESTVQTGFYFLFLVIVAAVTFILTRYFEAKYVQDELEGE
jgi:uncharacterized coiled-coil DUF342 family protein